MNLQYLIKCVRRIRIENFREEIKLALTTIKYYLDKQNTKLDMVVKVDGTKYRLVDLESLFIINPKFEEYVWCHLKPAKNDVFIDIGAHIGKYTLPIAKIVGVQGKVIAIEPDPDNFEALLEGIKMNKLTNIVALNVAAYDKQCELPFLCRYD